MGVNSRNLAGSVLIFLVGAALGALTTYKLIAPAGGLAAAARELERSVALVWYHDESGWHQSVTVSKC